MVCPPEIADVLLDILQHGLLACRVLGWQGESDYCAVMADHLHNIPALLKNYSPDALRSYWDIERPSFASQWGAASLKLWEELWERLRPFVEQRTQVVG